MPLSWVALTAISPVIHTLGSRKVAVYLKLGKNDVAWNKSFFRWDGQMNRYPKPKPAEKGKHYTEMRIEATVHGYFGPVEVMIVKDGRWERSGNCRQSKSLGFSERVEMWDPGELITA